MKIKTRNEIYLSGLSAPMNEELLRDFSGIAKKGRKENGRYAALSAFPDFVRNGKFATLNEHLQGDLEANRTIGYDVEVETSDRFVFTLKTEVDPKEYIKGLSKCFPGVRITHDYVSTEVGPAVNVVQYQDGEIIEQGQVEANTVEAYNMYFDLWGEYAQEERDKYRYSPSQKKYVLKTKLDQPTIYRLSIDYGRSGYLKGVFESTSRQVGLLISSAITVYFGEVLGKHSDVSTSLSSEDIKQVTNDPEAIKLFRKHSLETGLNPFNYLEENEDWEAIQREGRFTNKDLPEDEIKERLGLEAIQEAIRGVREAWEGELDNEEEEEYSELMECLDDLDDYIKEALDDPEEFVIPYDLIKGHRREAEQKEANLTGDIEPTIVDDLLNDDQE